MDLFEVLTWHRPEFGKGGGVEAERGGMERWSGGVEIGARRI